MLISLWHAGSTLVRSEVGVAVQPHEAVYPFRVGEHNRSYILIFVLSSANLGHAIHANYSLSPVLVGLHHHFVQARIWVHTAPRCFTR